MQFAKLTRDIFEVARLTHPLFRQRFEPFDFEFERSYFCFNLFAGVVHRVLPDQLQSLQRNSSKRCAFLFRCNLGGQNAFALVAARSAIRADRRAVDDAHRLKRTWKMKLASSGRAARISVLRRHVCRMSP